ncbi:MAG: hypothetical protein Tsb005_09280 [Gammaproteobacteria bacterium]
MDTKQKHRALGAIAIIGLAVVLVPLIFVKGQQRAGGFAQQNATQSSLELAITDADDSAATDETKQNHAKHESATVQHNSEKNTVKQTKAIAVVDQPEAKEKAQPSNLYFKTFADIKANTKSSSNHKADNLPVEQLDNDENANTPDEINDSLSANTQEQSTADAKPAVEKVITNNNAALNGKAMWAIQLASLSDTANIQALVKKVSAAGFNVYTQQVKMSNGKILTRVLVGPMNQKSVAKTTQAKLLETTKIKGILVFGPTDAQGGNTKITAPAKSNKQSYGKNARTNTQSTSKLAAASANNLRKVWVVQLQTLNDKRQAQSLAKQLRAQGFSVYSKVEQARHGKPQIHMYVGPAISEKQANFLRKRLYKQADLRGTVVAYDPLKLSQLIIDDKRYAL